MDKVTRQISQFISLILRHKPETIGITLDEHGWADVKDLIAGICKEGYILDEEKLEAIVAEDEKQRYSYSEDHRRIRANQGHSVNVDVELKEMLPPDVLYHGTGQKYYDSIMQKGLLPKSRLYVHLSRDKVTAEKVGSRHGKPVVLSVDSGSMKTDGYLFWLSENGVWLTKSVPVKYLKCLS